MGDEESNQINLLHWLRGHIHPLAVNSCDPSLFTCKTVYFTLLHEKRVIQRLTARRLSYENGF